MPFILTDWEDIESYPQFSLDRGVWTATRKGLCPNASVRAVIDETFPDPLLGYSGAAFYSETFFWVRAVGMKFEGPPNGQLRQGTDGRGYYDPWYVTIMYESPRGGVGYGHDAGHQSGAGGNKTGPGGQDGSSGGQNVTFLTATGSIGCEYLTLPKNSLRWLADRSGKDRALDISTIDNFESECGVPADLNPGKVGCTIEHTLTWNYVASPPWQAIRQTAGRVNEKTWNGAPRGTALFLGANWEQQFSTTGVPWYKLTYKFSEKNNNPDDINNPRGWNWFLRTITDATDATKNVSRYDELILKSFRDPVSGALVKRPLFEYKDFKYLFKQPPLP